MSSIDPRFTRGVDQYCPLVEVHGIAIVEVLCALGVRWKQLQWVVDIHRCGPSPTIGTPLILRHGLRFRIPEWWPLKRPTFLERLLASQVVCCAPGRRPWDWSKAGTSPDGVSTLKPWRVVYLRAPKWARAGWSRDSCCCLLFQSNFLNLLIFCRRNLLEHLKAMLQDQAWGPEDGRIGSTSLSSCLLECRDLQMRQQQRSIEHEGRHKDKVFIRG